MMIMGLGYGFYLLDGVEELPAQVERRAPRVGGLILIGSSFVLLAFIAFVFRDAMLGGGTVLVVTNLVFPLILLLGGVVMLLSRRQYTFTAESVKCRSRGLLGRREWEEPLSNYRGILPDRRNAGRQGVFYTLTLKHRSRRSRDIMIYQSRSPAGLRERQERCARLLGVAALLKTADGFSERPAADLDKSVRQRVAEGSLPLAFDPASRPPGHGLALRIEGDTLVLRSHMRPLWTLLFGTVLLLPVGIALSGGLGMGHALVATGGWLHIILLAAGAAGLGWRSLVVEELLVSPREVRRRLLIGRWAVAESALPCDKIEEVVVATPPSWQMGVRVLTIADSGTVTFGMMLSKAQRRWVRDCVIAVISR